MRLDKGQGTKEGLAWGSFIDKIDSTGWSELRIGGAGQAVSNSVKMYAAGFVEGLLTCIRISQYYHNTRMLLLQSEKSHHSLLAIRSQLQSQLEYVKANVNLVEHLARGSHRPPLAARALRLVPDVGDDGRVQLRCETFQGTHFEPRRLFPAELDG